MTTWKSTSDTTKNRIFGGVVTGSLIFFLVLLACPVFSQEKLLVDPKPQPDDAYIVASVPAQVGSDQSKAGLTSEVPQIRIALIEKMPSLPKPYKMRDWKKVAQDLDSILFDFEKTGQHFPLIFWGEPFGKTPGKTFAFPSYVGDTRGTQEAITALGAINGASVAGIDKSRQAHDWVKLSMLYYNEDLNLYLNTKGAVTGNSFWYELFPNILFFRIYWHYPDTPGMEKQFVEIANRWYEASVAMGGKTNPYRVPDFNHTAFDFQDFKPKSNNLWTEPCAAAAIAWIQYMAYVKTGDQKYLTAAKWAMDYLDSLERNPWYEIMLPHGAYIAARMNAEVGTRFDVEKLVNWCFDASNKRRWGVTHGKFGDLDCAGLVGSVTKDHEYVFAMNTFNLANSLVPLVRYDPRFARAIGRWMLNAANSSRYFYPNQLPASHQTDSQWAAKYDPDGSIAYEGLRSEATYIDRIKADIATYRGKIVDGDYRSTIFTDNSFQVFREEMTNGNSGFQHIWKFSVTPAERYFLSIVGKADSERECHVAVSSSLEGPFLEVATISLISVPIGKSFPLEISSTDVYLKITSECLSSTPTRLSFDDIYITSYTGVSPHSTGDAKTSGWGETNLALYGSVFVGIFGGIIQETDVEGILQLDCLATDYWGSDSHPTFLYYNPYPETKSISLDLGEDAQSIFDKVSNSFLMNDVSGRQMISIPGDSARVLVLVPSDQLHLFKPLHLQNQT